MYLSIAQYIRNLFNLACIYYRYISKLTIILKTSSYCDDLIFDIPQTKSTPAISDLKQILFAKSFSSWNPILKPFVVILSITPYWIIE